MAITHPIKGRGDIGTILNGSTIEENQEEDVGKKIHLHPQRTMDQFNTIFVHIPRCRIIVCKECGTGVVKAHVATHLNSKHAYLTVSTRTDVVRVVRAMNDLAEDEDRVVYPEPGSDPIPHLRIWQDGIKCEAKENDATTCGYIRRTVQDMQLHCRNKHNWTNPRKRGRTSKGPRIETNRMWIKGVCCQKFAHAGRLGRLFEVSSQDRGEAKGDTGGESVMIQRRLEAVFQETTAVLDEVDKKANARIEPDRNRYVTHAWLNRTGWARHLGGLDREWLLELIQKPRRNEKALSKVCWAVQMVIWKAQQASRPSVVGFPAMNYINRREMGSETNEKPFNARQTGKTMAKYAGWWSSVIRYVWRTHELEVMKAQETEADAQENRDGGSKGVRGRRPPYRLTASQIVWLWKIKQVAGEDEEEAEDGSQHQPIEGGDEDVESEEDIDEEKEGLLEAHVLGLLLSLLDHHLKDDEYKSAFVSATAVMGVDGDRGWKDPLVYTPIISAVVTIARMLVLYTAVKTRQDRVTEIMEKEGYVRQDADEMAVSHFELIKESANRFMTLTSYGGMPSPMDWLLRLRTYGMKIRFNTNADGVIEWVGDTLLYGHIRFTMPGLRSMIHGLVETARFELQKRLLLLDIDEDGRLAEGATPLPTIHWDSIVDNPAEMKVGWNFFQDKRNTFGGVDGKSWLAHRVIHEKRLQEVFVDVQATNPSVPEGRGVVWRARAVREYEKAMQAFREHLLVLVHTTGGLPARGTEVVTVQYMNSPNGESRGVFIEDGLMVYVTMYHKGIGASAKAKIIHRYLPREVGELLFYYLWMVMPFWRKLEGAVRKEAVKEASPFIWEPREEEPWARPQRGKRGRESDEGEGESEVRRRDVDEEEREDEREEEREEEQGRGTKEEEPSLRGPEKWDTNRVRRAIQRVSIRWLGVKLNIMAWRHSGKAIYRKYINDKAVIKAVVEGDEDEDGEDDAFDIQTGHSSKIGGTVYGRPITESPFSTEAQRAALRRVSMEWHRFLLFKSALEMHPKKGTRAAEARKEAVEEEFRRWRKMRAVDTQRQLESLVGAGARFRSVQRPAIEAIMHQKSPIVVVMGTGAGKSMAFMLPASCSTGVTIVVVPLVSLRGNLKDRCVQAGIDCVEWDSRKPQEWASVVLVTPESAVSESFGGFINRQRAMGRLDRIVVDECHVVLDSTGGWRTRMLALRDLVKAETQLVYLTATMRPRDEGEFIALMGLPAKKECQWFRGQTTRKNVKYQIQRYDQKEEDEDEVLVQLVEEKKRQYPMPGQIIVYCDTVAKTVRLAKLLDCVCYHRQVGSRGEKAELVRQLTEGRCKGAMG
ncbi:hypothetical protein G6011_09532 [Alternaria panax]|uniref:Helicase ATP-binding domain-containing protein n=1 Tax=Alternaria panax TaxID=48097 RepID=A0AAD4IBF8_9PLEO|nr:hypothetical protein G6011_09532 [Alternaria panax]